MLNEIDEKLFKQIFDHTLIKLSYTDNLINTTNKEENQMIVKNIRQKQRQTFKIR